MPTCFFYRTEGQGHYAIPQKNGFILYYESIYCLALQTMATVSNFHLLSMQNTDFKSNGHFVYVGNKTRLLVTIFLLFFFPTHDKYSTDLQHCFTDR